jgi:hypothetical protein
MGPRDRGTWDMSTELCKSAAAGEVSALFERWNKALLIGDPGEVVALYAENSILLPTVSSKPRRTA